MVLQTAQGRQGYGHIEINEHEPKVTQPEMKAPGIYSPRRQDLFKDSVEKIAQLERKLREGTATPLDLEHLESLRYMMYDGPFGC